VRPKNFSISRCLGALLTASLLVVPPVRVGYTQKTVKSQIPEKILVSFEFSCAKRRNCPTALKGAVDAAFRKLPGRGVKSWGDRAFPYDLDGDGKAEYFVPLDCGATGNCWWGIFQEEPVRFLGMVNAQYIYVHQRTSDWSNVTTYSRGGSREGFVNIYEFINGRYIRKSWYESFSRDLFHAPDFLEKTGSPNCESMK
jgi:hypothetical protein